MSKRLVIIVLVIIALLLAFSGTPLVQAMGNFVLSLFNLIGALLGLLLRSVT